MYYTRYRPSGASGWLPPGVKWLLLTNAAVFVMDYFAHVLFRGDPFRVFGLVPHQALFSGYLWQPVTYLFLHGGFWHILINMLTLWMFGMDLERDWGTRRFLEYFFLCGVGAGVCVIVASALFGGMGIRTIGASGAVYGLLLAFGLLYPNRVVLFSFLFPIKAKYFVMIIGAIAFMSSFSTGSGVSHIAHLGGMIFGYLYLGAKLPRINLLAGLQRRYREWKLARARKRFQVYLRKHDHDQDRDRWVH
ncbi:MAG: rhomboid family intramembrane serine protease [Acidobacteria bacterium]|nr:rhomboid family intramembrane serine protease [Acidobacteriota bacterium]